VELQELKSAVRAIAENKMSFLDILLKVRRVLVRKKSEFILSIRACAMVGEAQFNLIQR